MTYFILLSFFAGVAIAMQANINSYLAVLLTSSIFATLFALISSVICISLASFFFVKELPSFELIRTVPLYLYIIVGILSAFALATFYFVIPKIGILTMLSFALSGQLVFSLISSNYGWFQMPVSSFSISKIMGVSSMLLGIFLINKG